MATPIAIPLANRKAAWIGAGLASVAVAAVGFPVFGVPLAAGIAAYASIRLSKPCAILRGRRLSQRQQRRAAVIAGGAMLGVGVVFSGALSALDLANKLEHRLQDALKAAHRRGELQPGLIFEACQLVCAQAAVVELPSHSKPGIAKLSGYAAHNRTIYQWRGAPGARDMAPAHEY